MTDGCPTNTDRAWAPALPLFIASEFEVRCYWCRCSIAVGEPAAFYPEPKGDRTGGFSLGALRFRFLPAIAHERCHHEAHP